MDLLPLFCIRNMYEIVTAFYSLQFYAGKFINSTDSQIPLESTFLMNQMVTSNMQKIPYLCVKLLFIIHYQNQCNFYGHFDGYITTVQ